ncbi:MAG: BMP family ABC transporter substrate-binding protein, partial [Anaerolineae bacterium]|nr:BMP family ABC transporter substrate-binding protein [Anaerolineae bacterium]
MRKWFYGTLAVMLVLSVLAGCGAEPTAVPATAVPATAAPATAVPSKVMKVGMVSDVGGIDDASFNQNTWEGLQKAQTELGVEAKFIESQAQADYEKNITEFAEQNYDMIITVGFLLGDAT